MEPKPTNRQQRGRNGRRRPTHVPMLNSERRQEATRTEEDIHVCPECASDMVQPIEWAPVDMRRWRVEVRCPECEWGSAAIYPQHVLDRYDAILDEGTASLMEDLAKLERSNLEEEGNRFLEALNAGHILPEDF